MRIGLLVLVCACSGEDAHRHPVQPRQEAAVTAPADAGVPEVTGAPAKLDEAMTVSYWATAEEKDAANKFGLEDWAAAKAAFGKLKTNPRIELMLGLCDEHLNDATNAAAHLAAAYKGLPQIAD